MNKDLSDKEIEDFSNLTNKVLAEICRISDAHNIDRDSALKYFADMLTAFTEVATIQNYDSKQTNADRIRSMTDEELADMLHNNGSYLPEFLREYIELKKILDVQQPEVQLLEDLTEKLKDNQFILFADTQGIEKFEQMLKIQALDDDTLENRRFRIMSRWNNKIPYTVQILRNKLETLCGTSF